MSDNSYTHQILNSFDNCYLALNGSPTLQKVMLFTPLEGEGYYKSAEGHCFFISDLSKAGVSNSGFSILDSKGVFVEVLFFEVKPHSPIIGVLGYENGRIEQNNTVQCFDVNPNMLVGDEPSKLQLHGFYEATSTHNKGYATSTITLEGMGAEEFSSIRFLDGGTIGQEGHMNDAIKLYKEENNQS